MNNNKRITKYQNIWLKQDDIRNNYFKSDDYAYRKIR